MAWRSRASGWTRRVLWAGRNFLLAAALAACGGGDGSSQRVTVDKTSLSFNASYADHPGPTQIVHATYTGDEMIVGVPKGTEVPYWLSVSVIAQNGKAADLAVSVSTVLSPGDYTTVLRFATGTGNGSDAVWVDLPVSYTLAHGVALTPSQLSLTANGGVVEEQEIAVAITPSGNATWTATADAGLHLAATTGTTAHPIRVSYDAMAQALLPGVARLNVQVSVALPTRTVTVIVPVTVDVGEHRVYAVRSGFALTSLPGVNKLTASVAVVDNAGVDTGTWSADADQPWLVVEGIAGDVLSFHADPTDVPDGLHLATVTVHSTGARLAEPARVRVGLHVSGAAPVQGQLDASAAMRAGVLVADPVRPWVWRLTALRDHAVAHNVYSGAREADIALPAARDSIAISGDGRTLYASGSATTRWEEPRNINRFDIDTGAGLPAFEGLGYPIEMVFRPGGHEILADGYPEFHDAETGALLNFSSPWYLHTNALWELAASADQRYVYAATRGMSPGTLLRLGVTLSGSTPTLGFTDGGFFDLGSGIAGHLSPAPDGSTACAMDFQPQQVSDGFRVYAPDGAGRLQVVRTIAGSDPEKDFPYAVAIGPDGRMVLAMGGQVSCYGSTLGAMTDSYTLPPVYAMGDVVVSGDGERAIVSAVQDAGYSTMLLLGYPMHQD